MKKLRSRSAITLKYSKFKNKKVKVSYQYRAGWKGGFYSFDLNEPINVNNFSYFLRKSSKTHNAANGGTIKVRGGKGFEIMIDAYNPSTHQNEYITVTFK